jgi:cysteine desulfurase / selenocysteine lyase
MVNLDQDWEQVFPMLKHWVFFDAANQMIPGRFWLDGLKECLAIYEYAPFGHADHPFLTATFQDCIKRSARLIHAEPSEVTNIYRVMTASNLIINDLLDWEKGDNVVFTDLDYPSIPFIFSGLAKAKGVELRRIKNVDGEILLSDVEKAVDDRTKLVSVNHTMCWCGFTYDVRAVSDIAHEHDAYVLDDSIQSVGAIDVDVKKDDVDFMVTGSYKWQCGPEGAGIFYMKQELIDGFEPSFRNYIHADLPSGIPFSHRDHDNLSSWDHPLVSNANRFDMGVCVTPILFGWNETLKFYEKIGIDDIERKVRSNGDYCVDRLNEIGCKVLTPEDPKKRHGLIMYTTGDYDLDAKSYSAFNSDWSGEKPIKLCHRGIGGIIGLRISNHFFNSKADIDYLIDTQKKVLANQ